MSTLIDLSHVIVDGMTTYPGLPAPVIADHLTREAAETIYGPGITFQIGMVTMCTNTGTYLDVPFQHAHLRRDVDLEAFLVGVRCVHRPESPAAVAGGSRGKRGQPALGCNRLRAELLRCL